MLSNFRGHRLDGAAGVRKRSPYFAPRHGIIAKRFVHASEGIEFQHLALGFYFSTPAHADL